MRDTFFQLNFLNVQGIFSQKKYIVIAIFRQFSDVKNGGQFQQPYILAQLVTSQPQRIRTSYAKES